MSRTKSPNPGGVTIHLTVKALQDVRVSELAGKLIRRLADLNEQAAEPAPPAGREEEAK